MIIFWLLHVLLPLDGQNWCEVIEGSRLYGNDFHLFSKATSDPYVRVRLADDETWTKPVTKCGLIIVYHSIMFIQLFQCFQLQKRGSFVLIIFFHTFANVMSQVIE